MNEPERNHVIRRIMQQRQVFLAEGWPEEEATTRAIDLELARLSEENQSAIESLRHAMQAREDY